MRHTRYPYHVHVQRDALALRDAGFDVDVICDHEPGRPYYERLEGISVLRMPLHHKRDALGAHDDRCPHGAPRDTARAPVAARLPVLWSLRGPLECAISAVDDPLPVVLEVPLLAQLAWRRGGAPGPVRRVSNLSGAMRTWEDPGTHGPDCRREIGGDR